MGIISLEKINHLYWLGRYTERVFTTIKSFEGYYDRMIDQDETAYQDFCRRLNIPDIYGSKEAFVEEYVYDEKNPDSLYSNLARAFDNAVILREEISSEVLSYIQMSLDLLKSHGHKQAALLDLQEIVDYLFAFWGSVDDCVENEDCRNIMKCGKYVERLDLYMRLSYDYRRIEKEFSKFLNRLHRIQIWYSTENLGKLTEILNKKERWTEDYYDALNALGGIIEVI